MPSRMDHVADASGAELARLARLYDFPDFVKTAEMGGMHHTDRGLDAAVYADLVRRQFPCHTKVAAWLSALYYQEKRAEFHPKDQKRIEARLDHYARYWQIKAAVDAVRARHAELYKGAEADIPDSAFAFVWHGDDGHKERRLPLRNAVEVKAAADWLEQYRDAVAYADRRVIAGKVMEKAAAFGAALPAAQREFLEKQAGRGVCDPAEVVQMLRNRAALATAPGLRTKMAELADAVAADPKNFFQPAKMVKMAELVDTFDRDNGLVGKYAPGLDRPEDVIFKATFEKAAKDLAGQVATTSGKVYERGQFSKLALDDVRALLGDEFADRVRGGLGVDAEKMAEEVAALPRPDAQLLDTLLSENGISPLLTKAASAGRGLSREGLEAIAARYGR